MLSDNYRNFSRLDVYDRERLTRLVASGKTPREAMLILAERLEGLKQTDSRRLRAKALRDLADELRDTNG